ncbi:MAG: hypothetical protein LBK70_00350 [Clostridiales bacterium]|jgi:hypothetical protein|nr:hypothetical protein [Clostridiales bacterium]
MQKPIMMWSAHPLAKWFKRFVFNSTVELPDGEKIKIDNNRYVSHSTFKWQMYSDLSMGKVQPIKGLIEQQTNVSIRSTTLLEIKQGDAVFLKSTASAKGMYFMVVEVSQDYIYTPKMKRSYQHLELKSIPMKDVSLWE